LGGFCGRFPHLARACGLVRRRKPGDGAERFACKLLGR
jgi:hypothetical protein